jgi:hypothetical protein
MIYINKLSLKKAKNLRCPKWKSGMSSVARYSRRGLFKKSQTSAAIEQKQSFFANRYIPSFSHSLLSKEKARLGEG